MILCSDGHGEVCFEGRRCPACDLRDELDEKISKLTDEINDLERELGV